MFVAITVVPELKTVSLDYVELEFSCWVCQLSLSCVNLFALKTWSSSHFLLYFAFERWDRWGGNKKKTWHFDPFPTFLLQESRGPVWKMSECVSSREPQLKPNCPGSDLCSDKLEHIILSKDVILLLTVILALFSLVEACVMWHSVYPEWLWDRDTHSIIYFPAATQQERCDKDDLCFCLVSLIMFYRMFIKVLN